MITFLDLLLFFLIYTYVIFFIKKGLNIANYDDDNTPFRFSLELWKILLTIKIRCFNGSKVTTLNLILINVT